MLTGTRGFGSGFKPNTFPRKILYWKELTKIPTFQRRPWISQMDWKLVMSDSIGRSFLSSVLTLLQRFICELSGFETCVKIFPFCHVQCYCDCSSNCWVFHVHVLPILWGWHIWRPNETTATHNCTFPSAIWIICF